MTPNDPPDDPRWDRLIHLVAGQLPSDEAAALHRWADAEPRRREFLAQLEEIWQATGASPASPEEWDAESELRRVRAETDGEGRVIARVGPAHAAPDFDRINGHRSRAVAVARLAAVIAVILGGGLLWRLRIPAPTPAAPSPVTMAEYRTARGERLLLHLPDGTQVMLAPGGVLRRPSTYGDRDRTVELEGEAYFVVTHDSTRPFAVHTSSVVARDLGTRFVVRAYPDEAATDVVVAEGAVAVGRTVAGATPTAARPLSSDSLVLAPRQRARITTGGNIVLTQRIALDRYLGWTEGRLVFERTPLSAVVRQLGRWYGIEIGLADSSLRDRRLTATLVEEHAAQAVDLVATSLQLSVSRSGNRYVLRAMR